MEQSEHPERLGTAEGSVKESIRKEYTKPALTFHDDLRSVTGLEVS